MRKTLFILPFLAMATASSAATPIDKNYVRSLAAPGKLVAVIEYSDASGQVVDRKGFATTDKWKAVSPTEFLVASNTKLKLFGIKPCGGSLVVRDEDYSGSCEDYAQANLQVMLNTPKVIYCRAFMSEQNAPEQDVTCYGYYFVPNGMDTVDMLEEQLVSIGAAELMKKSDGTFLRPDLAEAQAIGEKGYGMWADPRYKSK